METEGRENERERKKETTTLVGGRK